MTTSPRHTLTAMIAVLDHARTHNLTVPVEVHRPGHYLGSDRGNDTVGVDLGRVTLNDVVCWEESLAENFDYVAELTDSPTGHAYTRHLYVGQIPNGVRVTIVARTPIEALASVKG